MPYFDIIVDIEIIRRFYKTESEVKRIAEEIIKKNNHIKTVLCQTTRINGDHRIRQLKWLLGEHKTDTIYSEFGCKFYLDLNSVFFSPRLSNERMRIANQIRNGEAILNMFGGVGSFSLVIARYAPALKIFSIDINPIATHLTLININLNNVRKKVVAIFGDAENLTQAYFFQKVDRVLMLLPEKSYELLRVAINALKNRQGYVHYYDFIHSYKEEDPISKGIDKITKKLLKHNINFEIKFGKIVRSIGPNWYQIVLDIEIL
jgi:tRNA (guanine37-N1)-methyltransferase